jgi:hypothetical protein
MINMIDIVMMIENLFNELFLDHYINHRYINYNSL